jgi:trk system potassium uptake protein TrkA
VTSGDNSNILCARIARETYGIERVVARIYDPRGRSSTSGSASRPWRPSRGPPIQVLRRLLPAETRHDWSTRPARSGSSSDPIPREWAGQAREAQPSPAGSGSRR